MESSAYSPAGAADLEVGYLFRKSWEVFKDHLGFTIAVFLVYALLTNGPARIDDGGFLASLLGLIQLLIAGPLTAGTYLVALKLIRREPVEFGEMFDGFRVFGKALGVFLLYSLIVVIGVLLLIVPGIIAAIGLLPAMFLVTQADYGVVDTLRAAWEMTKGYKGQIFIVGLALIGLNLLGLLALIIGMIFTGALSLLVVAAVYDELAKAVG